MSPAELRAAAERLEHRVTDARLAQGRMADPTVPADVSANDAALGADAARRLAEIQEAWTIPGRMPPYHAYMQELVRRDWPTLARAIERSLSDPRE